jgi:hypothetical protein
MFLAIIVVSPFQFRELTRRPLLLFSSQHQGIDEQSRRSRK